MKQPTTPLEAIEQAGYDYPGDGVEPAARIALRQIQDMINALPRDDYLWLNADKVLALFEAPQA